MKKILVAILSSLCTCLAFADGPDKAALAIGCKGVFSGKTYELKTSIDPRYDYFLFKNQPKSFTLFAGHDLTKNITLQMELEYCSDKGGELQLRDDSKSATISFERLTYSYPALDIPVFLHLRFKPLCFLFGVYAGPYVSFPLGDVSVRHETYLSTNAWDGSNQSVVNGTAPAAGPFFGGSCGFQIGFNFGSVMMLYVEMRQSKDFGPFAVTVDGQRKELFQAEGASGAIGLEIKLF